MEKLLQRTIIGAKLDSSDCHPGTRLAIVKRCKIFIAECNNIEKLRWLVGLAGGGKSAIMKLLLEKTPDNVVLGASVFLSVNGRKGGTKVFTTIAYQLAIKCEPYRQFIRQDISRDPSLLRESLPAQLRKFIVDSFVHQRLFTTSPQIPIIIDGLDECDNPLAQRDLLG